MSLPSRRRLGRRLTDPFPVVGGNSIRAADHGPTFFHSMLEAMAAATATIDVEMYLWDDDEVGRTFVDALRAAAARGLRVRVLVDAYGARSVEPRLGAINEAGGDVRTYNPFRLRFLNRYIHRTHRKLLVCDAALAYFGGAGFSVHWSGGRRRGDDPWHDRMFEVRGPVVRQLVDTFESDHSRWRAGDVVDRPLRPDATMDLSRPGNAELRVLRGWPDARDFRVALIEQIWAAKQRVWLGTPYFIPPPSLLHALTGALRRGVDVRIIVPSGNYAHPLLWHGSRRHYAWFLRRGAKIYEYTRGFYHAKLAVIDQRSAITGSSNLDYWSWDRNAEIDLVATDAGTVNSFASWFEADAACSRSVTLREMSMRGVFDRLKDRIAGWIEDWL